MRCHQPALCVDLICCLQVWHARLQRRACGECLLPTVLSPGTPRPACSSTRMPYRAAVCVRALGLQGSTRTLFGCCLKVFYRERAARMYDPLALGIGEQCLSVHVVLA